MSVTEKQLVFTIKGMDCAEEVAILKRELSPIVGEDHLFFDILNGKLSIESSAAKTSAERIIQVIAQTGMHAKLWSADPGNIEQKGFLSRYGRTLFMVASGAITAAGFTSHAFIAKSVYAALGSESKGISHQIPLIVRILYGLATILGAWHVFPKSWYALKRLRPDINLLMVIAIFGAIGINEWFEAATVSFLFAVSLALESWSVSRARKAIESLINLSPEKAHIRNPDGSETEVLVKEIQVGSIFVVKPGEKIPLDGHIIKGESDINQAPITGESVPVQRGISDSVFAATINGNGALVIRSTKLAENTTLAHIIKMVGETQSKRAPSEQWVERFAKIYTPCVLALSFLLLFIPPVFLSGDWQTWLYRALTLLVIACPCALVISTPVSIVAAIAASARQGVLIKGGVYVELPAHLKAIAFDKTGTLTQGQPQVVSVIPMNGHTEAELLERAAAMEVQSDHPLAAAIVSYAKTKQVRIIAADNLQTIQGKGATAQINGTRYWLGSHRYLEERGQETADVHQKLEALSSSGHSIVIIGNESHVCGFIALADKVRQDAKPALEQLRQLGIEHVVMLSGDNQGTAQAIANQVGIKEIQAELLPENKVQAIEALVARYKNVAMVGDGINDAPALGRATIGIAMGVAGSDATIETADIALMSDNLLKLPWLIQHSRRTLKVIRQNIGFSLAVKAIFVLLTLAGYASLWTAIAADMGASFIVIFNGLRLLNIRPNPNLQVKQP